MAKSAVKLVYYYAFATLYGLAGGCANVRSPHSASAFFLLKCLHDSCSSALLC